MLFTQHRSIKNIPEICLFYEILTVFAKAMKGTIDQFIQVVYYFYLRSRQSKFDKVQTISRSRVIA